LLTGSSRSLTLSPLPVSSPCPLALSPRPIVLSHLLTPRSHSLFTRTPLSLSPLPVSSPGLLDAALTRTLCLLSCLRLSLSPLSPMFIQSLTRLSIVSSPVSSTLSALLSPLCALLSQSPHSVSSRRT
ncbi:unnamed protein product, partial [Pleuronectes platessa]